MGQGMTKAEAIAHDAGVHEWRQRLYRQMVLTETIAQASGAEPDPMGMAATFADSNDLWEGDDLPGWLTEYAERASELVATMLGREVVSIDKGDSDEDDEL